MLNTDDSKRAGPSMRIAARARLPLENGATPDILTFEDVQGGDGRDHFALVFGCPYPAGSVPLVRVHSECVTGDVLGSLRCDCGKQLEEALDLFAREGGILIYLRQEGRGIGLREKIKAYCLQQEGFDTFEANVALGHPEDNRDYALAAGMLAALGIGQIRLLTRNHHKARALATRGIDIAEVVPTGVYRTRFNQRYLEAKERKLEKGLRGLQRGPVKTAS